MNIAPDWASDVDDLVEALGGQLGPLPYDATPARLYRADDLYEDLGSVGYSGCFDQRIYARSAKAGGARIGVVEALAQRLHDHGITVARDEFRSARRIVGVMGATKYFSNSEREDGLLGIATSGVVFVPGGPGTMQEVFQDAAQNAYETMGASSPMVFLDSAGETWWRASGVLDALDHAFTSAAGGRRPGWNLVGAVDSVGEVIAHLES